MAKTQAAAEAQQHGPTMRQASPHEQPVVAQPAAKAHQSRFKAEEVERRQKYVDLGHEDIARILTIKNVIAENLDRFTDTFFDFLSHIEEAAPLFKNRAVLEEAKKRKREHLIAMVQGEYGAAYAEERFQLGELYGKVGLDTRVFLGAFHHLLRAIGAEIMKRFVKSPEVGFDIFMSLKKVAF
jgi:rsbT co-antagonist protein RsbR